MRSEAFESVPAAPPPPHEWVAGARVLRGALSAAEQNDLLGAVAATLETTPPFQPTMPGSGAPFSVDMLNLGPLGWVSDPAGYRYQGTHPATGAPWPPIPASLLGLWRRILPDAPPPEACLVNLYRDTARMGLHQDRDEAALDVPVLSVSLGSTATFRIGGARRGDPTVSTRLRSGDVLVLEGASRLAFHGIDRILKDERAALSAFPALRAYARVNLTLRRVTIEEGDKR